MLERHEIRDLYDIEFLLRKGIALKVSREDLDRLLHISKRFKESDFSVALGSLVKKDIRTYYMAHKFTYLQEKIAGLRA